MANDSSSSTIAKRKKLEEQLVSAKKELADAEYEHSVQTQEDALNKEYENFEKEKNGEIEKLKLSLEEREQLIAASFEKVKQNAEIISQQISDITALHGVAVSDAIMNSWASGENAIASYGTVLSNSTSQFIGEIMGVEAEIYDMQYQANATADSLAWMFATRADNLVGELANSYYSEANLDAMTHALRDSLVNTLERGYDVSGITSGLGSIVNAANEVANAARRAAQELANMGTLQANTYKIGMNGQAISEAMTKDEAIEWLNKHNKTGAYLMSGYAKGVHNLKKDELAWTQEQGGEAILSPSRNSVLTPLKAGDSVLTKEQTDHLFNWAKLDPSKFASLKLLDSIGSINKVGAAPTSNNTSVHIDNMLTVNGNVDDTNIKKMEIIANKAVDNLVAQMNKQIKYRNV